MDAVLGIVIKTMAILAVATGMAAHYTEQKK
jgi:hypothetical protein